MNREEITFHKNLRNARNLAGLSQQDLADKIHVTRQAISAWEMNRGKPDISILHGLCQIFHLSADEMMYGCVVSRADDNIPVPEPSGSSWRFESLKITGKGFYVVIDEDLGELFPILGFDFGRIATIVCELHRMGYMITEIFDNGFSIFLRTDAEAASFEGVLFSVIDCIIHHDNAPMEEHRNRYESMYSEYYEKVYDDVMKELYDREISRFQYYWVDKEENTRGFGDSREECERQAKAQGCKDYSILENH